MTAFFFGLACYNRGRPSWPKKPWNGRPPKRPNFRMLGTNWDSGPLAAEISWRGALVCRHLGQGPAPHLFSSWPEIRLRLPDALARTFEARPGLEILDELARARKTSGF